MGGALPLNTSAPLEMRTCETDKLGKYLTNTLHPEDPKQLQPDLVKQSLRQGAFLQKAKLNLRQGETERHATLTGLDVR